MRRLSLDFERETYKPAGWTGGLILAMALALALLLFAQFQHLSKIENEWEAELDTLQRMPQRKLSSLKVAGQESQQLRKEIASANEVLRQITLPWEQLLTRVESSVDDTVALLSVEPNLENRHVRISAEAKDMKAAMALVERLGSKGPLGRAYLADHEMRTQDPQKPVRITLVAEWTELSSDR